MSLKDKKKLLYIVESMGGGVFTYIVSLANELSDCYDVYVAYGLRPQTPKNFPVYFDPKVHLIPVMNFKRKISPLWDWRAFWEIRNIAIRVKPDLIHLHSTKAGVLGRWAFNGRKIPLFYTPHGYSFLMDNCSRGKCWSYYLIEWLTAKRSSITIACSRGEYRESLKLTKWVEYVDNGINLEEMERLLSDIEPQKYEYFTVFTLGRIDGQKNPVLFNQIARALPKVRFLWIGDGELRKCLTEPNIQITGWLDRGSALRKCAGADIFILTSKWEGLAISLLEAMYMKKLCAVSDCIGNRDVIQNKKNGFICSNLEEYVEAIKYAMAGKGERQIEQAFCEVTNHYNTTVMAEEYQRLYEKYSKKALKRQKGNGRQ